jgi:hypothetical protein
MEEPKGFFTTLFDFSFSEFIVPKIIKTLFGIGMLAAAVGALYFITWGFHSGFLAGLLTIILSPVVFVFYVILVRVYLEVVMVLFRIADNTTRMVQSKKE